MATAFAQLNTRIEAEAKREGDAAFARFVVALSLRFCVFT